MKFVLYPIREGTERTKNKRLPLRRLRPWLHTFECLNLRRGFYRNTHEVHDEWFVSRQGPCSSHEVFTHDSWSDSGPVVLVEYRLIHI